MWECGDWNACSAQSTQSRTCTLKTDCPTATTPKPAVSQSCTPTCTADTITCGEWSACSTDGKQTRDCKVQTCPGGTRAYPVTSQKCEPPKREPEPAVVIAPIDTPPTEPPAPEPEPTETHSGLTPEEKKKVDDLITTKTVVETFAALGDEAPEVFSVRVDKQGEVRWWKSQPSADGSTAPGIIVFDTDHDGLPDDLELRLGTDPKVPDITDPNGMPSAVVSREVLKTFFEKGDKPKELIALDFDADGIVERLTDRNLLGLKTYDVTRAYLVGDTSIFSGALYDAKKMEVRRAELKSLFEDGDIPTQDMLAYDPAGDGKPLAKVSRSVLKSFFERGDKPTQAQFASLLDSVDIAFLRGLPIGQPLHSGEEDPTLDLNLVNTHGIADTTGAFDPAKWGTFYGHAAPNTVILLYIYSYVPMVLSTTTDANGDFSYDLSDSVVDGSHTAYLAVADDTGTITKKSTGLSLFVRGAIAATSEEELLQQDAAVTPVAAEQKATRWYLYGAILTVLLALGAVWFIARGKKGSATKPKSPFIQ